MSFKQLQRILLVSQPSLLYKCICIPDFSWEPRLNSNYFDTVVYVNHLLATVTISEKCKSTLVAFFRSSGQVTLSYSTHSVVVKSALDDILMGMIPTGVL
jgi:hypothetical protein